MAETPGIVWFWGTSGTDAINRIVAGERAERVL
jgi:hypothetical protein